MGIRKNGFMVAGHRGYCCTKFPENTLSAFRAALGDGVDMLELDVRLSSDLALVVMHDAAVDRTTDGTGKVSEMTLAQLRALNAGTAELPQRIPLFEEVLALACESKTPLNIEIKEYYSEQNEARAVRCIEDVLSLVEKYGMQDHILINSFDAWVLEYVYKKYGKRYPLHGFYPYSIMKNVDINPDEYLYCACITGDDEKGACEYLSSRGIEPWLGGGVVSREHLERMISCGACLVTCHDPEDIIAKLREMGYR